MLEIDYTCINDINYPAIYIIENIVNGKRYVGYCLNFADAFYYAKRTSAKGVRKKTKLYKDVLEYGIDNFEISIEYYPNISKQELLNIVNKTIMDCNSLQPNGYNASLLKKPRGKEGDNVYRVIKTKTKERMKQKKMIELYPWEYGGAP